MHLAHTRMLYKCKIIEAIGPSFPYRQKHEWLFFPQSLVPENIKILNERKQNPSFIGCYQNFPIRSARICAACSSSKGCYEAKSVVAVADHQLAIPQTLFFP